MKGLVQVIEQQRVPAAICTTAGHSVVTNEPHAAIGDGTSNECRRLAFMMDNDVQPVTASVRVPKGSEAAFHDFIYEIRRWWPLANTYFQDDFAAAVIEPMKGGRWYEVDKSGKRLSWGEVRSYEPPDRVVLSYAVSPDGRPEPPEKASEVEIRFVPEHGAESRERPATRIEITHRQFDRHGEHANALRERLASPQGWPLILSSFARLYSTRS